MSEIVQTNEHGVEQQAPKNEFYAYADDAGIAEVRISNDVPFALRVYLGIGNFIAGQLRNADTQQPPTLPEFLRDLANMVEQSAQVQAANDGTLEPPEPEAA
jgi:hypothetical protein